MAPDPILLVKESAAPDWGGTPTQSPLPESRIAMPCKLCGRFLTDPRSVMAGFGPTCAARIGALNG
jgi:hypothetical protein